MQKKLLAWKTKGMNQDLSVSAFNPEFSFENMNLRLSTNEHNTLLSWVNERGTRLMDISIDTTPWSEEEKVYESSIQGMPIGTAVINHALVLFTTKTRYSTDTPVLKPDYIYYLYYNSDKTAFEGIQLYNGNLGFDPTFPIGTLVSYEAEHIQKVYWEDGKNQPRLINIKASEETLRKWNMTVSNQVCTYFDFVRAFNSSEEVIIEKNQSGGTFAPGSIQYCFTYYTQYGQQSNIVWHSPLYYLSHTDRGASPEDKVSDSFTINITKYDTSFDYIRLYSIQRTSIDGTPICRLIEDFSLKDANNAIIYTDTGTSGSSIDPTQLLFIGGKELIAHAMIDKDQTLFLGNITLTNISVEPLKAYFKDNREKEQDDPSKILPEFIVDSVDSSIKKLSLDYSNGIYSNTFQLNNSHEQISTFKGGDTYRLGFQLQKKTGEWSEPVFIDDVRNSKYPSSFLPSGNDGTQVKLPYGKVTFPLLSTGFDFSPYQKIRPVIVYPSVADREVLCQGVLNPTVFNVEDRQTNSPYAQSSWFYRPYTSHIFNPGSKDLGGYVAVESQSTPYDLSDDGDSTPVYVVFLDILDTNFETVATSRTLYANEKGEYDSVIYLGGRRYAFTKKSSSWNSEASAYRSDVLFISAPSSPFQYPNLTEVGAYGFAANRSSIAPLIFLFNNSSTYYKTTFYYINPHINADERGGEVLTYSHYDSISEAVDANGNPTQLSNVEVQGSTKKYEQVFSPSAIEGVSTNTQFFVDHSIVTLNSPDVEFNTEVQSFPLKGLKLRIVGAIPITSYASAHEIQIDTPMLPKNYGQDTSGGTLEQGLFGQGDLGLDIQHPNINVNSGNRFISKAIWNDVSVIKEGDKVKTGNTLVNYTVYPWQKNGALNNDIRAIAEASSVLKTKKFSHLSYSYISTYLNNPYLVGGSLDASLILTENDIIKNYRLHKQDRSSEDINYYPNIDKVLYTNIGYGNPKITSPIAMKYKSTSHVVIALGDSGKSSQETIPILPFGRIAGFDIGRYNLNDGSPYWRDTPIRFSQEGIDLNSYFNVTSYSFLWLGELYRTVDREAIFGGKGQEALKSNVWCVGGNAVPIPEISIDNPDRTITLYWTIGDTYYQRYDSLKTYPFTQEDTNQNTEILSFMCETHVNLDGRYDRNRGQIQNYNIGPQNFNLINPVYSQKDNFFTSRALYTNVKEDFSYPNMLTYSQTKSSGADIDEWTHLTLASTLELDGDKGRLTALNKFNDQIIAFQDTGISQILYNENTQISTTEGVPIEIANSGKVQGKRYLSGSIGCSNKWSIVQTPSGIYFIDSYDKGIYRFNGGLSSLSATKGFNTWTKQHVDSLYKWDPKFFNDFVAYYDKQNQDVLFINKNTCLAFSEKLDTFTSFYSYESAPFFINLEDTGVWISRDRSLLDSGYFLWKHQSGNYCEIFNQSVPYSMTLIGNAEPQFDKIFTNLEFRAIVEDDGTEDENTRFVPYLPFDSLEVWNEYQHGIGSLQNRYGISSMMHHELNNISSLKRKFRIWRCDIPRDNAPVDTTTESIMGISRSKRNPLDRIRNPWIYLKLAKVSETSKRTEIHDLLMTYYL